MSMDVSGSMSGSKLNLCKKTCEILVNELKASDKFGLVSFSEEAKLVLPLSFMTKDNKVRALSLIKKLNAGGCTNLSGGLTMGVSELQEAGARSTEKNTIQSMMLLTDGHANRGVSDTASLTSLAAGILASTPNISVYTFGYGSDHNDALLKSLSEVSDTKGSYYFIDQEDDVSSAFGDCIGGLLSVTAQNIKLTITGSNIVVRNDNARLTPIENRVSAVAGTSEWVVTLGDMFAEETKDMVVEVTSLPNEAGSNHEINVKLDYVDVLAARQVSLGPVSGIIEIVAGSTGSPANKYVTLQVMRILVVDALSKAKVLADQGDLDGARTLITAEIANIAATTKTLPVTLDDQLIVTSYISDLTEALSGLSTQAEYKSVGSKGMSRKQQTHSAQRCNAASEMEFNPYRGKTKMGMAQKMKGAMW